MSANVTVRDPGGPHNAVELRRRQRVKNWLVAGVIAALCALFYLLTIVRMGRF
jgi:hypothetical protein